MNLPKTREVRTPTLRQRHQALSATALTNKRAEPEQIKRRHLFDNSFTKKAT